MALHVTESFPFGDIVMSSASSPTLVDPLVIQRIAYEPALPDSMAVDLVAAYCISFVLPNPVHSFSFDFTLARCKSRGAANSGEGLDAQSWDIDDGIVMLGTEDGDALQARMPWLAAQSMRYSIEYLTNGFRLAFPYIAPNTTVGFHFVLAYNRNDRSDDSEWFAVDVTHDKLSQFPVAKQLSGILGRDTR